MSIARLDAALGDAERVLLDSSTLIAFLSPAERVHPLAEHILARIVDDDDLLRGYYSVVSAAEILVRPLRTSRERFTFMHSFLAQFPNLADLPMDMVVATQTATVRAATNLRLPDAVVASGLLAGCEAIVTNDAAWKGKLEPLFRQFRWIYLGDYL